MLQNGCKQLRSSLFAVYYKYNYKFYMFLRNDGSIWADDNVLNPVVW